MTKGAGFHCGLKQLSKAWLSSLKPCFVPLAGHKVGIGLPGQISSGALPESEPYQHHLLATHVLMINDQ